MAKILRKRELAPRIFEMVLESPRLARKAQPGTIAHIGLNLGVISPTLFAMMVLMALVTTMATAPALKRLLPHPG